MPSRNDNDPILDLMSRVAPGHLAETATCLLGFVLLERMRRRVAEQAAKGREPESTTEDEADAALALAVFDSPSPEDLVVPEQKRGFVRELCVIKSIALAGGSLGRAAQRLRRPVADGVLAER